VDRTTLIRLLAIGFLIYGVYNALLLLGILVAPASAILLVGAIAKTASAFIVAFGLWSRKPWASAAVVLTGVVIAVLWLAYGFVLGIVAYLYAIVMAGLALLLAIVIASYVQRGASSVI
jgi:hypothetical protein